MAKKDSLVYADPSSRIIAKVSKNSFNVIKTFKKEFIGTRVLFDRLITHSFKINSTISQEELDIQVEINMYEDLGLDTSTQYKIGYIKKKLDYEESYIIEAFAFEIEKVKEDLDFILEKHSYIDFIATPNLIFKTLYHNKILSPKQDVFVYLGENESFFTIYKDGNYLSSSSLTNISQIAKSIDTKEMQIDKLFDILSHKGLVSSLYSQEEMYIYESLDKTFLDIFSKINNIAMHNRSIYGFENIDRIFFSTSKGRIKGLKEFVVNFSDNAIELRDFNLFKQKRDDLFLEKIASSYILDKYLENDNRYNLTFLEKTPPFYKTTFGKYIIFSVIILFLSSLYPLYLYNKIDTLQKKYTVVSVKYDKISKQAQEIKSKIKKIKIKLKNSKKIIKSQDKELANIAHTIDQLINMKSKKRSYTATILQITDALKKYNLSLKNFKEYKNNQIVLQIVAKNGKRDNIAKFMKELKKKGFVEVSTKEIRLNKEYYISEIEIAK